MATCPGCGAKGREGATFTIEPVSIEEGGLIARPLGTWSLAGAQMKVSASTKDRLTCDACGWSVIGQLRHDGFYADPGRQ